MKILEDFIYNIIEQRKQKGDFDKRTDLLSRFMSLTDGIITSPIPLFGFSLICITFATAETGEPYSLEYLKDAILNFFIAGRGKDKVLQKGCNC